MTPIRLALIGLSQSAKTSWASQGHLPYLQSTRGRERYRIVALLNSSEEAARKAIRSYGLGDDVKAYGSAKDLAADSNVDLVVCTTRVDVHYDTIRPSIEGGKAIFVEWPVAENVGRATELAKLARLSGSRTLVGIQARVAPASRKVKDIIDAGTIGTVVSSTVQAYTSRGGGDSISEGLAYFLDKRVGGNPVTIAFGHMIDFIHSVLGEYQSYNSHLQIQRPRQSIVNGNGGTVPAVSDVPDLVSVHGTLESSDHVARGASLLVTFLTGPPFPGTTPFVWTITGEKGRIQVSNAYGPFIQSEGSAYPIPIVLQDFASHETKEIQWSWDSWQEQLPPRGRNIAKIYDVYAEGRAEEYGVMDLEAAVVRHKQLDGMLYQ